MVSRIFSVDLPVCFSFFFSANDSTILCDNFFPNYCDQNSTVCVSGSNGYVKCECKSDFLPINTTSCSGKMTRILFTNQIPHYSRCLTPKRATSLRGGPFFCIIVPGKLSSRQEMLQQWRAVDNTATGLTSPRFEPKTSCFSDDRIIAPLHQLAEFMFSKLM